MNILLRSSLYRINHSTSQSSTLWCNFVKLEYLKECSQYVARFEMNGYNRPQNFLGVDQLQDPESFPEVRADLKFYRADLKFYKDRIMRFSESQNKLSSLCDILFFTRSKLQTTALLKFILNVYLADLCTLKRNKQKNLDYARQTREQSIENFIYQLDEEINFRSLDLKATQDKLNYVAQKIDELEHD